MSVFLRTIPADFVCSRRELLMGRFLCSVLNNRAHRATEGSHRLLQGGKCQENNDNRQTNV